MLKKSAKPLNPTFSLDAGRAENKALARIYNHVMHSLLILALYIPLLWYTVHLRTQYLQDTNLLDLHPLHLVVVISLIFVPLVVLRLLGVKWQGRESSPPEV